MKKISLHQLTVMIFLHLMTLNFISLPARVFHTAKQDSWLVIMSNLLLDILAIVLIMYMLRKSGKRNFYEFLCTLYGKVVSKIVLFVLLLAYLTSVIKVLTELDAFMVFNLYEDNFAWYYYVLPIVATIGYMTSKGIKNLGRIAELFYLLLAVGIIFISIAHIGSIDWLFFSPAFKNGLPNILKAMYETAPWFGGEMFVLAIFGEVDLNNNKKNKLWLALVAGFFIVMLTIVTFYGLFEVSAYQHSFALADISQAVSSSSSLYRLQWILVSLWIVCMVGFAGTMFYASTNCLRYIFNGKDNNWFNIALLLVIGVVLYFYKQNTDFESVLHNTYLSGFCLFCNIGLPIILFVSTLIRRKKFNAISNS